MGNYSEYLKNAEKIAAGKPGGSPRERIENRVNSALDMDEAVRAAMGRLDGFIAAYLRDREPEIGLAESYLADEDSAKWGEVVMRDIQQIALMAKKPDGSQEAVLLDDLRILLHRLKNLPGGR